MDSTESKTKVNNGKTKGRLTAAKQKQASSTAIDYLTIQKVKYYFEKGMSGTEIAQRLNYSKQDYNNLIQRCKRNGFWFSAAEVKEIRGRRKKEKEEEKRKNLENILKQ